MQTYKNLKVWQVNQQSIRMVVELEKQLPKDYAFQHIWKQLFRAITSVGANLAEGQDSYEGKEFPRYINIAIRSSIEADHWLASIKNLLGNNIKLLNELDATNTETIKMLKGLLKSIKAKRNGSI